MNLRLALAAASTVAAPAAFAQTNISPTDKFCWAENVGYMNWHDAGNPAGAQGVKVNATFLGGFIWCENIGWVNTGDGSPTNGSSYANVNGTDFGVNILGNGNLSGYGWGENVGWINFNTAPTLSAFSQQARYDAAASRFRGYAWGENIGWVNMNDPTKFVGTLCPADFNHDGQVDFFDYLDFVAAFDAEDISADFNGDNQVDFFDYLDFASAFDQGC
jgi:hypothetical protein